jgi:hypothetical protein
MDQLTGKMRGSRRDTLREGHMTEGVEVSSTDSCLQVFRSPGEQLGEGILLTLRIRNLRSYASLSTVSL